MKSIARLLLATSSLATALCASGLLAQPAPPAEPAAAEPPVTAPAVQALPAAPAAEPVPPAPQPAAVPAGAAAEPSPYDSGAAPTAPSSPPAQPAAAAAKASDAPATLLDLSADYSIGGMGGVGVMYTRFAGKNAVQVCGEGAVIIDHAFTLGGGGCGIASKMDGSKYGTGPHDPDDRLSFGYGGAIARYHFFSRRALNVSVGTLVGAGGISLGTWDGSGDDLETDYSFNRHEVVFVVEPQVGGHANLTRWLRFGLHAGYRVVSGVDTVGLDAGDVSGPTLGGTIQAGWF